MTLPDSHVGRVVDKLSEMDIAQDAFTTFTSDNGPDKEGGK